MTQSEIPNLIPSVRISKQTPSERLLRLLRSWGADFVFSKHAGVRLMPDDQQHCGSLGGQRKTVRTSHPTGQKKSPTHARRAREWETAPRGDSGYSGRVRRSGFGISAGSEYALPIDESVCRGSESVVSICSLPCLLMAKTGWGHKVQYNTPESSPLRKVWVLF